MKKNILQKLDYKILNICSFKIKNRFLDRAMPIVTRLNNYGLVYIALAVFSIIIRYNINIAVNVLMALSLGVLIGEGFIKHLIKRSRPVLKDVKDYLLIKFPKSSSFPSGHTTSSFAVLGVLWFANSELKYIFLFIAVMISFSRLYLCVHYPSDVLAGIVLGLICGRIIITLSGNVYYTILVDKIISQIYYLL